MSNFTQLCMETNCFHEGLVVFLPERISFHISSDDYTFHVICKNVLWNTHVNKRMNHTNKQVFLSGIWKEFNVSLATMMTDHGETCTLIRTTVRSIYFNKSPVHLVILSRTCMISSASVSLWTYNFTWCWNQIFMCSNISFDRSSASWIADSLKSFKDNFGICDILSEIIINCALVSWNNRFLGLFSFICIRLDYKSIFL